MSEQIPYRIVVDPQAFYVPEQSSEEAGQYVFRYVIRIRNSGRLPARLISRHWIITDIDSRIQEVKGDGVVGEQPLILPGQTYEYTSGVVLGSPVGTMRGSYRMIGEDGTGFDALIPEFLLSVPRVLH